jgi:hypothetical protein
MIGTITAKGSLTPLQTHLLRLGLNKIGRRTDPDQQAASDEILIDTEDPSIHRQYHCVIEVTINKDNGFDYLLFSYETASNLTLLGGERAPLHKLDQIFLREGADWYVGENTAIVLHLPK